MSVDFRARGAVPEDSGFHFADVVPTLLPTASENAEIIARDVLPAIEAIRAEVVTSLRGMAAGAIQRRMP